MFSSSTLDILISVVLVILTLSLIVQTIQAMAKKFFKLKSAQLESSLVDLFEVVLDERGTSTMVQKVAAFVNPRAGHRPVDTTTRAGRLYAEVVLALTRIGRVAATGGHMLDSLSKEDLARVLTEVPPSTLRESFDANAGAFATCLDELRASVDAARASLPNNSAAADATAECLRVASLLDQIRPADPKLPTVDAATTMKFARVADIATSIAALLPQISTHAVAPAPSAPSGATPAPIDLARDVREKMSKLEGARDLCERDVASIKRALERVETWYDTVMQGFEERYNRSMKTWSLLIGAVVVLTLNADVLAIYSRVASDNAKQAAIVARKTEILDHMAEVKKQAAAANGDAADAQKQLKALNDELNALAGTYGQFGVAPLDWSDVTPRSILGWAIMVMLLSFGAPFWNDVLESLFGVKALLRKKGDIKNVEEQAGQGNPKV